MNEQTSALPQIQREMPSAVFYQSAITSLSSIVPIVPRDNEPKSLDIIRGNLVVLTMAVAPANTPILKTIHKPIFS